MNFWFDKLKTRFSNLFKKEENRTSISEYTNLTINTGENLEYLGRRKYWKIYVSGDCTVNGTIQLNKGPDNEVADKIFFKRFSSWGI